MAQKNSATLVARKQDLEDGVPMRCPFTLGAFLYLKKHGVNINIMEPDHDSKDADIAPFFLCDGNKCIEYRRDLNKLPLIGLSSYWDFDERWRSTKSEAERNDIEMYTQEILKPLLRLRRYVFSTYMDNQSDMMLTEAIDSIELLSNLMGQKSSFMEMHYTYASQLDISVATIGIVVTKKMDQSPLWRKLRRHTTLFAMAHRFSPVMKVVPEALDLSSELIGDVATNFKVFLETRCRRLGVSRNYIYHCNLSPNNEYGLPDGSLVVKTFRAHKSYDSLSPLLGAEVYGLESFKKYNIAAEIIGYAGNQNIQCVLLKYYPDGDIAPKLRDTNFSWSDGLKILMDVSYILNAIHTFESPYKYVYGDFKPENFLFDEDRVIVCDFESLHEEGEENNLESPLYKEDVLRGQKRGRLYGHQKGDIFKFGKFIITLVTVIPILEPTGRDSREMTVVEKIREKVLNWLETKEWKKIICPSIVRSGCRENTAREILDLAIDCMDPNAENRPIGSTIVDRLIAIEERGVN